jgi:hypothetical protein
MRLQIYELVKWSDKNDLHSLPKLFGFAAASAAAISVV